MSDKENENQIDEAFGELLANFVRQNPCLYNKKCKEYKDKTFVADTWRTIANTCNMSVDTVQRQWKILRNQFTGEHRLMMTYEPSGTGNDTSKRPHKTWYLYDSLFFLASHVAHRNTSSNFIRKNTMINQSSPSSSNSAPQLTFIPASGTFSTMWNPDLITVSDESNVSIENPSTELSMSEASIASTTSMTSSTSFSQPRPLATAKRNLISPPPDQFAARKMKESQKNQEQLSKVICNTENITENINKLVHKLAEKRSESISDDGEEAAMSKALFYALKRVNSKYKIQCYMECLSIINKYHNMTAEETIQNL